MTKTQIQTAQQRAKILRKEQRAPFVRAAWIVFVAGFVAGVIAPVPSTVGVAIWLVSWVVAATLLVRGRSFAQRAVPLTAAALTAADIRGAATYDAEYEAALEAARAEVAKLAREDQA